MSAKVVVTDQAFGNVTREEAVARRFGSVFNAHQCVSEAETKEALAGAAVAFVNFAPITRPVLEAMAPGALVIRYGIGYDNVDIAAARELGISVSNVPDYGADTVADHAVTCILALHRKVKQLDSRIRSDGWLRPNDLGSMPGFSQTTVGLIGTGRIGRAAAARLKPFGFTIIAHDPFVSAPTLEGTGIKLVPLKKLLQESDVVSLHAPLTPENHQLINEVTLSTMRPGALVVNTSRGGLIDEEALADALIEGRLGGAALDVFDPEPLAPGSRLRKLENVLLTPHAAFFSDESLANLQRLAAEEAARHLAGEKLRCPVT
ncbi:C-terminal binding protein [Pseudarthrobacter sp. NamE2]|uniref:C-terminal binding protein n=1 Tax=Pseudarthrobacter sp. NamE2 TaxID=2576838 RepID=UPI0010FE9B44|nr:C-terminal binding protein [Pseudarthrobacter sp. NamE2]TLM80991.1 C-terminal binding protein [Pseudarthrobacter sp. NamE2]